MRQPVYIALLGPGDEADFLAGVRASRKLHAPWVSPPATRKAFRELAARAQGPANFAYLVRRRDDDSLVGFIHVSNIIRGAFRSAFLGYYAFAGQEGQGFMRAGLQLVVRKAFSFHGLHRLEANIQPSNKPSVALAKSCGFSLEGFSPRYLKIGGRWRDHERWAILADR